MKYLNLKIYFFIVSIGFFHSMEAIAAPVITGLTVSKNDSGDEVVVLSGAGFNAGPDIVLYSTFSGGVDDELIPLDNPAVGEWVSNRNSARFMKYNGNDIGFKIYNEDPSRPQLRAMFQHTADIFMAYTVTMHEDSFFPYAEGEGVFPVSSSWKMAWLMDDGGYATDGKADLCVPSQTGYGSMQLSGNDGRLTYIDKGSVWWDFNGSNHLSFYTKVAQEDPQNANGIIFFQSANQDKGIYTFLSTDRPAALSGTDKTYEYNQVNFPGWYKKGDYDNFQAIYDNIYMAIGPNHIARLELTDNPVYASSTKVFTIPYEEWTDNNIRINIKTVALPDVHKLFLYIVDKFDKRTQVGYSLNSVKSTRSTAIQYFLILD